MTPTIGRYCALHGEAEERDLVAGADFRQPRFRREVFLRFYEFHLRYRTHPGCVYFVLPEIFVRERLDEEARLWFAYINGNTQNPVTSWLIFRAFPSPQAATPKALGAFWKSEAKRLAFDTDRRYFRTKFPATVERYRALLRGGSQAAMFERLAAHGSEEANFRALWAWCNRHYVYFGRLSVFSYLEYLRICGVPVACDQLFLHDLEGSKSHRNGLAKVLGRDDLDWHDSNPRFNGHYSAGLLQWLADEADLLLAEARTRFQGQPFARDVGFFTLESALCTYKSWHRPNRRYPNVYADMLVERIRVGEQAWGERLPLFWQARAHALPAHLRLEDNPADPGVCPRKQNHYLTTGEVIMMDRDWPCFRNAFNDEVNAQQARAFR